MRLFLLTFFAIYGALHLYLFLKVKNAFSPGIYASFFLFLLMILMISAPVMVRLFVSEGYESAARLLSYIGYSWMAALFFYFCISISIDVFNLIPRIIGPIINMDLSSFIARPRQAFLVSVTLALGICVYGYFEALNIKVERLTIETAKLPSGTDRLRIVQISDVHLGLTVGAERLKRVVRIVDAEKPDILVSTGDLVDVQVNNLSGLAGLLRDVKTRYGKYAVTGNHEYYAGIDQSLQFTRDAGFSILRGGQVATSVITVIGMDDPTGVLMGIDRPLDEAGLLKRLPKDSFILLLKHRPVVEKDTEGLFDLQLSGHTHKGQIFPFGFLSAISYPMNAGRFDLRGGSILYVSRGTGTWGPAIRFLAPPEVTVIDLIRKGSKGSVHGS